MREARNQGSDGGWAPGGAPVKFRTRKELISKARQANALSRSAVRPSTSEMAQAQAALMGAVTWHLVLRKSRA